MRPVIVILDWLGAHATTVLAAGVGIGLLVPPLAALVRPALVVFIIFPLAIALTRIEWSALIAYLRRVPLVVALVLWMLVVAPLATWAALTPTPLPPTLVTGIVLMAAAPPIVSAAAIALFLKLDAAIIVVVTVVSMWATPLVLPPMALWLLDLKIDISLYAFMGRLAAFVAGAFVLSWAARRLIGRQRLLELARPLDGLAVLSMLIFAIGIMDGITEAFLARPGYVLLATAMAFVVNIALQVLAAVAFWHLKPAAALATGLMSGNKNMGLILVVLGDAAHFDTVIFFAMGQIPMFTLPALLAPIYRRINIASQTGRGHDT